MLPFGRILPTSALTKAACPPMREHIVELNRYAVTLLNPLFQTFPST